VIDDVLERACEVFHDAWVAWARRKNNLHLPRECLRVGQIAVNGMWCPRCCVDLMPWSDMPPEGQERIRELLRPVVSALVPGQTRGFVTLQADVLDEMVGTAVQREREACRRIASSYAEEAERQAEHESERVFNGAGSWTHGDRRHNDGRRDVAEQIERRIRERSRT
jgi:hypothetical protein